MAEQEKASIEVLRQLFEFLRFLKCVKKSVAKNGVKNESINRFIGCMPGKDGDMFEVVLLNEFDKMEGEW